MSAAVAPGPDELVEDRCPHCGGLLGITLSLNDRDRAELRYLAANPGIWGGPLDRGQEHTDPTFQAWVRNGLIEAAKKADGRWGYFITPTGRRLLRERTAP